MGKVFPLFSKFFDGRVGMWFRFVFSVFSLVGYVVIFLTFHDFEGRKGVCVCVCVLPFFRSVSVVGWGMVSLDSPRIFQWLG